MSFEQQGFLSPDMQQHIVSIRDRESDWFGLAERLNRLGQKIVLAQRELESDRGYADYRVVAMLFYTRALSSFQASVLLIERGMIVEANTMTRALVETACVMAGIHKNKQEFVTQLADADY